VLSGLNGEVSQKGNILRENTDFLSMVRKSLGDVRNLEVIYLNQPTQANFDAVLEAYQSYAGTSNKSIFKSSSRNSTTPIRVGSPSNR